MSSHGCRCSTASVSECASGRSQSRRSKTFAAVGRRPVGRGIRALQGVRGCCRRSAGTANGRREPAGDMTRRLTPPVRQAPENGSAADRADARLPRASWWALSRREQVCNLRCGTGVEPATSRFKVWCSAIELTTIDAAFVTVQSRNAPRQRAASDCSNPRSPVRNAAGPAASTSLPPRDAGGSRTHLKTALQAVASPSGSSVERNR